MRRVEGVLVVVTVLLSVALLGGGLALASDGAPESQADNSSFDCSGAADCTHYVTHSADIACVGVGCWDTRLEHEATGEQEFSEDSTLAAGGADNDGETETEAPCPSCDVIGLNEYPEYRYR